ncbi:MAG: FAD binding domain-containing protein [Solirubrobacterales bacterium]
MKPAAFSYVRADSAEEALAALASNGDDAKLLAGGQSLIPMMNLRLAQPEVLVDIGRARDLEGIVHDGGLRIGATTRQAALLTSADARALAPLIADAMRYVSHPAIRSRGTVGGTLAHADPAAELPAVMVALDATMTVRGPAGTRNVPASDFFVTYLTTAIDEGEMLSEVYVPPPVVAGDVRDVFLEVARRHGDYALVAVATRLVLDPTGSVTHARIVLSGVGDVPVRATDAEQRLVGERLGDEAIAREAGLLAAGPLSPPADIHASSRYRQDVAAVLVRRAIVAAGKEQR